MRAPLEPTENLDPDDAIRGQAMALVRGALRRLTRPMLEKILLARFSGERTRVRSAIRALVDAGELAYTCEHGCSFVELSFQRPVRLSRTVVVKPDHFHYAAEPQDVVVSLLPGGAFGSGRHPSTRLAVRAVEQAFACGGLWGRSFPDRVLDLGTGSGILMITALQMGAAWAVGVDVDPCAVAEARENVRCNRLWGRAKVTDAVPETTWGPFDLVTANLRYPTLIRMAGLVGSLLTRKGAAVVSGIKTEEFPEVRQAYEGKNFGLLWTAEEKGWLGALFSKSG